MVSELTCVTVRVVVFLIGDGGKLGHGAVGSDRAEEKIDHCITNLPSTYALQNFDK